MRAIILCSVLVLAGCGEGDFDKAARQYAFLERNGGDSLQLCQAARKVADAALENGNSRDFRLWDVTSDIQCQAHSMGR